MARPPGLLVKLLHHGLGRHQRRGLRLRREPGRAQRAALPWHCRGRQRWLARHANRRTGIPAYAELRCLSNFSFLKGASWPEELLERAKALGYSALALTDECSMAGAVRADVEAKERGLKLLHGSQFTVEGETLFAPFTLVELACNLQGYGNLCEFITSLRRSSKKGSYRLERAAINPQALADCVVLVSPDRESTDAQLEALARWLLENFSSATCVAMLRSKRVRSLPKEASHGCVRYHGKALFKLSG